MSRKPPKDDGDENTESFRSPALDEARAEIMRLRRESGRRDERTQYFDPADALTRADRGEAARRNVGSEARNRPAWPAREKAAQNRPGDAAAADESRTRLFNPASAARDKDGAPAEAAAKKAGEATDDPVVGWLVVVKGPGKGKSLEIGLGANTLGRSEQQKLRVDFGDRHISRERHAILIYEPTTQKYFLQSGDARNLTYIGSQLVLSPTELLGGETIVVGETHLRFVPFDVSAYS